jgi:hypothetical protein
MYQGYLKGTNQRRPFFEARERNSERVASLIKCLCAEAVLDDLVAIGALQKGILSH